MPMSTRLEIHAGLSELEARCGVRRREFERALRSYLGRPPGWLSRSEVAQVLGVTVKRVDQLRTEGRLRSRRNDESREIWFDPLSVTGLNRRGKPHG